MNKKNRELWTKRNLKTKVKFSVDLEFMASIQRRLLLGRRTDFTKKAMFQCRVGSLDICIEDGSRCSFYPELKVDVQDQDDIIENQRKEQLRQKENQSLVRQIKRKAKFMGSKEVPNEAVEKFFGNGIKLEMLMKVPTARFFNTVSLIKSFSFEPIYVTLQLFSSTQVFTLTSLQFGYLIWTLYVALKLKIFDGYLAQISSIMSEASLLVFMIIGLVFQLGGGDQNFSESTKNTLQFMAIGVVAVSAFFSFIELMILLVMSPIQYFKNRELNKRIQKIKQAREELKLVRVKKNKNASIVHPAPKLASLEGSPVDEIKPQEEVSEMSKVPILTDVLNDTVGSQKPSDKKSGVAKAKRRIVRNSNKVAIKPTELQSNLQPATTPNEIPQGIGAQLAEAFKDDYPKVEEMEEGELGRDSRENLPTPTQIPRVSITPTENLAELNSEKVRDSPNNGLRLQESHSTLEEGRPMMGIRDMEHLAPTWMDVARKGSNNNAATTTTPNAPKRARVSSQSSSSKQNSSKVSLKEKNN